MAVTKSEKLPKELSVGQVAKRCGVAVSTIHFYETKGLISGWRNNGNQRRYSRDVLRRVSIIKVAQQLGVSLNDIGEALGRLPKQRTPTPADWNNLSKQWKKDLNTRISRLEQLRDDLDGCIGCGCLSMKVCPLWNPGDEVAAKGDGAYFINGG